MQVIDAILKLKDQFTPVLSKVTSHLNEHRSQQMRVAKSIQATGKNVSALGEKFALLSAPILAAATAGAKLNSDFTTGLAKVSTLVDTTTVDMTKMRGELIALSNETGVSVTDLTEGTYQAISASVDAAKAVDFMKVSALGAKAGFTDMSTATDALTTIINAYGMETERASGMMDRLIITQNLGKTTVDEIGKSIGQVIPTAASAGMSIDELLASVASLTASGTQTSAAMTGMKAALSNIIKPTADAAKTAESLGLEFNQAHLAQVGWAKFLDEVKTATGGNIEMMGKLFGSTEALNTVLSLTGNGANKFTESLDAMANSTGATNEAIEKLDATPAAQLEKAVNQLKNAAMELAQGLTPLLARTSRMTKAFAEWLNNLTPLQKELLFTIGQFIVLGGVGLTVIGKGITLFGGWYGSAVKAAVAIEKAGSVTGALAAKFPFLQTALSGVMNGFRSFGGILSMMKGNFVSAFMTIGRAILSLRNPFMAIRALMATNPLGLALLALTIIIPFVIAHFHDFKQMILVVFNHIKNTVGTALDKVRAKFTIVFEKLKNVGDKFMAAYNQIMAAFGGTTEESGSLVSAALNTLGAVFGAVFDTIIWIITGFVGIYASIIGTVIDVAGDLISFIANVFTGNWEGAWNNIKDIFTHIFDGIKDVFSGVINFLSEGLDSILEKAGLARSESAAADGGCEAESHWTGATWFTGGKTFVHEQGPELINLPTGTQIVPHSESLKQQYQKGLSEGMAARGGTQSINIAKLADSIVVREESDIDKIAERLVFKLQQHGINNMVGAV